MLQEKDLLQDLLVLNKDIVKTYANYLIESSCPKERMLLQNQLKAASQDQFNIFTAMSEKGYYPTKNANPDDVCTAKTQMEQICKNMQ